ncbi:GDP-L-fucose synthase family protein [Methanobrevibacter sp. UBA313]|uniref:GDP-L-fucose synthase family protein n=1 Tax=Methanobrevibacter sp. UBA313 TaxID=1915477 RepID=UPI0039B94DE8
MEKNEKIYVTGHNGMVGSAIVRVLKRKGYTNIITKTSKELDLRNQNKTNEFIKKEKPNTIIIASAKVGGINANMNNLTGFLMDNLQIETNIISSAYKNNVENLMFLGSSCIYPREAQQPLKEDYLLTGPLEPTNEGYAIAKIAGLKACEYLNKEHDLNYISVMPCNLYGENDNFDPESSHVIAGIMQRMHLAKEENKSFIKIWGSGKPLREFLYVDDMAEATVFVLENYKGSDFINIGSFSEITIKELAETIQKVIGYEGELMFDTSKPDGMFRKKLDTTKINELGWQPKFSLENGLKKTYEWYLKNVYEK